MLIFWKQRLAFLATPKAGSTAVEVALESLSSAAMLRPPELKHTNLKRWREYVGPWLQASAGAPFTTVALMREPVDWLKSWYRFKLRDDHDDPLHRMEGVDFKNFAYQYVTPEGPSELNIGSQHGFLTDGEYRVDRIFRYEDMPAFIGFIEDHLDCAIELPRINVPPTVDVELKADDEQLLRQAMSRDIALYQTLSIER